MHKIAPIILVILIASGWIFISNKQFFLNRNTSMAPNSNISTETSVKPSEVIEKELTGVTKNTEVLIENLRIPWEIVFIDQNTFLVTERDGNLLKISLQDKNKSLVQKIEGVQHIGEGGLLGLALHPNFNDNNYLYLYFTTRTDGNLKNRLERYEYKDNKLSNKKIILENIPGAANHDGGRIAFGPDNMLYISTGDAQNEQSAQDKNSISGKILRITDEGSIPADNPFGNAIYSYGHRNVQGLAWDDKGQLWVTEHGPSGAQTGNDEVNLIEKGKNYGWPTIKGKQTRDGMELPVYESGTSSTWAPGQIVFYEGSLYFVGLRGEALYQAVIQNNEVTELKQHLKSEFGRLRTIVIGPDGLFYISTSNLDGRGNLRPGDDKIIRIAPKSL